MKDNVLEDLKKIKEEDLIKEVKEPRLERLVLLIIGVLLLVIIASRVLTSYPIPDLIKSRIESTPIKDNKIELKDLEIIFENNVYETIRSLYFQEQKVEFSLCLLGNKKFMKKPIYHINNFYQPKIHSQSLTHVSFESCSNSTLILLHTHPYKSCIASQQDLRFLKSSQEINSNQIMLVMCEPARFSVYK